MNKPSIIAVDDEPTVLNAVARDLRSAYRDDYRILRAESGNVALETLRELKRANDPVALLLVDQRMPGMSGVDFLEKAIGLYPDVKRVLLTAYADTDVAIKAINEVGLDHYLMKPWDPPESHLYPVLNGLLEEWRTTFRPPFEGVRIVGHRWSAECHAAKDFLVRNFLPYQWIDLEDDREHARQLLEAAGTDGERVPLILFPDGSFAIQPTIAELADKVGLRTRAEAPFYDLVIVGGGPAGLAGAVYGASEGLKTLMVEGEAPGGQAGTSSRIENYLGFPGGLAGGDLARRAVAQAEKFGAELLTPQHAVGVRREDPYRFIQLSDGSEVSCHALLIATGMSYRRLEATGIDRLTGAGVYYGSAITEARSCEDREVFIVGGGNSAGQAALYLSRLARSVTILIRGEALRPSMSHYLTEQIRVRPNIRVQPFSQVQAAEGDTRLERLVIANKQAGAIETVPADALFIFIGTAPRTDWVASLVARDEQGFILSGGDLLRNASVNMSSWTLSRDPLWLETSVPGIFVAGDVRHRSIKRVASAVGEGSMAVMFVHQHLASL